MDEGSCREQEDRRRKKKKKKKEDERVKHAVSIDVKRSISGNEDTGGEKKEKREEEKGRSKHKRKQEEIAKQYMSISKLWRMVIKELGIIC